MLGCRPQISLFSLVGRLFFVQSIDLLSSSLHGLVNVPTSPDLYQVILSQPYSLFRAVVSTMAPPGQSAEAVNPHQEDPAEETFEKSSPSSSPSPQRPAPVAHKSSLPYPTSEKTRTDGKVELHEADAWDKLGFSYPTWKKWMILTVIFVVQSSMNFNASVYGSAVEPLIEAFPYINEPGARTGQMIFLVAYAFGCELWAPWSEEIGRWPVLQASLLFDKYPEETEAS